MVQLHGGLKKLSFDFIIRLNKRLKSSVKCNQIRLCNLPTDITVQITQEALSNNLINQLEMQRKSRIFQVGLGSAFALLLALLLLCCYCNNLYKKRHITPNRGAHDVDQSMTKSSNDRVS